MNGFGACNKLPIILLRQSGTLVFRLYALDEPMAIRRQTKPELRHLQGRLPVGFQFGYLATSLFIYMRTRVRLIEVKGRRRCSKCQQKSHGWPLFRPKKCTFVNNLENLAYFLNFPLEKFGGFVGKQYFCIRFQGWTPGERKGKSSLNGLHKTEK